MGDIVALFSWRMVQLLSDRDPNSKPRRAPFLIPLSTARGTYSWPRLEFSRSIDRPSPRQLEACVPIQYIERPLESLLGPRHGRLHGDLHGYYQIA